MIPILINWEQYSLIIKIQELLVGVVLLLKFKQTFTFLIQIPNFERHIFILHLNNLCPD